MIAAGCAETARDRAARGGRSAAKRAQLRLSMSQVHKTRKGEWCGQSGICSSFCANHGQNRKGKQLQQAAKCAVVHNPEPGTKVRVHCIEHAQIPLACTLSPSLKKKKTPVKSCCTTARRSKRALTNSTICSWMCGTGTFSLFESALLYALLRNQHRNFVGLLRDWWDRHVNDLLLNLRHRKMHVHP